jgi:hypothetical protein
MFSCTIGLLKRACALGVANFGPAWKCGQIRHQGAALPNQVIRKRNATIERLQQGLPLQYNNVRDSMAYLEAAIEAGELTDMLRSKHDCVRDFMRELLSTVSPLFERPGCQWTWQTLEKEEVYGRKGSNES